ncbi:MAG: glutathione S-transferase family protein [Burkholderiales bacterium]
MSARFTLVSHALCPYVQRAAIVLLEKGVEFERREIDLANKPAWFLDVSPLGKTPVLLVDGEAIFESAVICEFLDETEGARLHPELPLPRAKHRAWMEFGSSLLNTIAAFYNAADDTALGARAQDIRHRFEQLEAATSEGPYFAGDHFGMVDAVFGPIFRYFDVFDTLGSFDFFGGLPKVSGWRARLAARHSVRAAAQGDYHALLRAFLGKRGSALSRRLAAAESVCALS